MQLKLNKWLVSVVRYTDFLNDMRTQRTLAIKRHLIFKNTIFFKILVGSYNC